MRRGEIWIATWPPDPARRARPVLIVSNDLRNGRPALLDVVVVKLTGLIRRDGTRKATNPWEDVLVRLKKPTIIRCGSVYTLEKATLTRRAGVIPLALMQLVEKRLLNVLGMEPPS